uniref:Uncharacterized protein n=1 Tax=Panagrolaimus sp. JU765 TaxID=591449 RepID=A0AC34QTM7_9BILA
MIADQFSRRRMFKFLLFLTIITVTAALTCHNSAENIAAHPQSDQPCQEPYCVYVKEVNIYNPQEVDLPSYFYSCSIIPSVTYKQGVPPYTLLNQCSSINLDGILYTIQICNTADFCNIGCENPVPYYPGTTTLSPWTQWPTTRRNGAEIACIFVPLLISFMYFFI